MPETNQNLNRVKNPNWLEANQLAIYKCGRGAELRTTVNVNVEQVIKAVLELVASKL